MIKVKITPLQFPLFQNDSFHKEIKNGTARKNPFYRKVPSLVSYYFITGLLLLQELYRQNLEKIKKKMFTKRIPSHLLQWIHFFRKRL